MGIKKIAQRVVNAYSSGGTSELMNQMKGPTNEAQPIDPQIFAMQKKAQDRASQFRAGMGQMRAEQENIAGEQARSGLAGQIAQNKAGFNQRGLLYSGMKQGADIDAASQSAANLAQQKVQIGQGLESQAQDLENQAMGAGMSVAGLQSQQLAQKMAFDQAKQAQRGAVLGGLFSAAGQIGGGYMGGR
jgi:hypothetical protein